MSRKTITLDGNDYVIVPRDEYEALETLAKLPPLPEPNADGNYPAAAYARAGIARGIIRDRARLGLSQAELARRAGIRVETLCRIESGKVTPTVGSIHKIDRALTSTEAARQRKGTGKRTSRSRKG
ncbi:MAG: helix-turn-helix transcriptional regulator [Planctomycetales bacterium]